MKIKVISDLHLEFDPNFYPDNNGANVLILSGDIFVIDYLRRSVESPYFDKALDFVHFVNRAANDYEHVVYVAGNHEYYNGKINSDFEYLRDVFKHLSNVHFLDNESIIIDNMKFIGSTLWTSANNNDHLTHYMLNRGLNDFHLITDNDGDKYFKFQSEKAYQLHLKAVDFIRNEVQDGEPCVVCTHHAPSFKSVTERYKNETVMNGGFCSDLSALILDYPNIKLWTHGHVHSCHDYEIGSTRVICNPKGYRNENPEFDPCHLVELN